MFANRHVLAALIVMPLLSLLGWWAAGHLAGEQPQPAREGMSYPLVEQSGCRYAGGDCALENVDVHLAVNVTQTGPGHFLEVQASLPLDAMLVAMGDPGVDLPPQSMTRRDDEGLRWRLALQSRPQPDHRIRFVAHARGIRWFGEAGTAFLQPVKRGPRLQ